MRIALTATLAFAAIWFVALRPKPPAAAPSDPAPATASPQSAPGKAAAQAQEAAGASQQSAAEHESAAGAVGERETPATNAPARSGAEKGAQPGRVDVRKAAGPKSSEAARAVLEDVGKGRIAVVLFWDRRLSDDRAVHRAVMGLDRRDGKVAVHKAPIGRLAQFEPITSGVPVVTSPTVLVIDRAGRARSVGGLTVRGELEELVTRALRVRP